jgi:Holliday junction resolvase-like predicted endonuclease
MAQQLWMGEEYVLQIDAHMRFVQVRTVRVNKRCDSGKIDVIMSREQQDCMLA